MYILKFSNFCDNSRLLYCIYKIVILGKVTSIHMSSLLAEKLHDD